MLESPHVSVGAAIASKIPNPVVSIPLAFASHFLLDKVPHWNPHLNTEVKKYGHPTQKTTLIVVCDVLLAIAIGCFFAWRVLPDTTHAITILLASLASVLPDVVEGPYFFLNMKSKFITNWIKFQKSIQSDTTAVLGLTIQLITLIGVFYWVLAV